MSAESPVNRTDVASDDPSAGDAPAARPRRNRRGRRRRGRRGKNPSAAQNPAVGTGERAPADPAGKPDAGQPPKPGPRPGSQPPRPVPGSAKPGATSEQPRSERQAPKPGPPGRARTTGQKAGHGPKPSDLAAPRTDRQTGTPAAMPRTKRRNGANGNRRGGPPASQSPQQQRLRTVRETSAGGLVLSSLDAPFDEIEAVLIGRMDRRGRMMWSLPKGHIETGETAEQTAIREVTEETGVCGTIISELGKIDYWFVSEGRRIHKTVHHYLLRYAGGELSDADYEVAEVAWVPLPELPRRLTYSDERRLARAVEGVVDELRNDPDRLARSEAESIRTEPNDYEKAAAARNQRRNEPPPPPRPRRRKRRPRRGGSGNVPGGNASSTPASGAAGTPSTGDRPGDSAPGPHADRGSGDG